MTCEDNGEPEEGIRLLHKARALCEPDTDLEMDLSVIT